VRARRRRARLCSGHRAALAKAGNCGCRLVAMDGKPARFSTS